MSTVLIRRFDGMDGSHYQPDAGPMDLAKTRAASAGDWIAWKCSQSINYVDPTFRNVRVQVSALGFKYRMFYHWLSSTTDPAAQAAWFLKCMGTWADGEGAMLDAEEAGITVDKCLVVLEAVEAVTHRPMSVYTGIYVAGGTIWKDPRIRTSKYGDRPMHLAAYISTTSLDSRLRAAGVRDLPIHAWQYSSITPVPGIAGIHVDNNAVLDFASMDRAVNAHMAPAPVPVPTPTPTPVPAPPASQVDSKIMVTVFHLIDSKAQFIGLSVLNSNGEHVAVMVEWTGPGSDPKVQDRMAKHYAAGAVDVQGATIEGFSTTTLVGPLPVGDELHNWNGEEFFRVNY